MKKFVMFATIALMGALTTSAYASPKTYQVTGPILEMTADTIVVEKGKEKWEIQRGVIVVPDTIKVGSKVTIQYVMTADSIVSKDASKEAKPAKK